MADIKSLPQNGFAPTNQAVAAHLREMADWIVEEDHPRVRNVFLVIETIDGELIRQTCGAPCDLARALGILTIAAARAAIGPER